MASLAQLCHLAFLRGVAVSPQDLDRLTAGYLLDSTTIALTDALATIRPGCGGRVATTTQAALKGTVRVGPWPNVRPATVYLGPRWPVAAPRRPLLLSFRACEKSPGPVNQSVRPRPSYAIPGARP